jgi:hypothetical protein
MNTIQRVIILAAIILIVLSALFPPYAAGRLPVGESIHSGIGYHPIWKPPTVEYAYGVLHKEKYDPAAGVDLTGYFVMFNKVGFIFQLVVILLISSIMLFIFRKRRRIH